MRVGAECFGLSRPTTCALSLFWLGLGVCLGLDLGPEAFPIAFLPPFLLFFPPTPFWIRPSAFPLRLPEDLLRFPKPPLDLADSLLILELFLPANFLGPISPAFFAVPLDLGTSLEVDEMRFSLGVATFFDLSFPRATPSDPEYWSSSAEQEAENLKKA